MDRVDGVSNTCLLTSDGVSLTGPAAGRRTARGSGGASTHSLNEADLQVM